MSTLAHCSQQCQLEEPFSWDDPQNVVHETEHEKRSRWEERRLQNIKNCGYLKQVEDPCSGSIKIRQFYCEEPECKFCGPRMREEMYKSLSTQIRQGESLRIVKLVGDLEEIKQQRAKLIRKYGGKNNCFSTGNDVLTEDGFCHEIEMVIKTGDEIGEAYTEVSFDDIERWVQKSYVIKKSGNLHRKEESNPPKEKKEKEPEDESNPKRRVQREEWIINSKNKRELQDIEDQVIKNTSHLQPTGFRELEKAMKERRIERKRLLEQNGFVILDHVTTFITIRLNDIKWITVQKPEQLKILE